MKAKKGFTLIELLVVVAIMGLLAALAVVALNNARARARDARRVSDVKQLQTALELYYLDQNEYPDLSLPGIVESLCLSSTSGLAVGCVGTTYMSLTPVNPSPRVDGGCDDTSYIYQPQSSGTNNTSYYITYCLGSATGTLTAGSHNGTPAGLVDD